MGIHEEFNDQRKFLYDEFGIKLNDEGKPIILNYESCAEKFLNRYYPEIYMSAEATIDIDKLLERLGLKLKYNEQPSGTALLDIATKTITVDKEYPDENFFGSVRISILHECVHWWLHRPMFLLKELPVFHCLGTCGKEESVYSYQAIEIALAIAMPLNKVRPHLENLMLLSRRPFEFINKAEKELSKIVRIFDVAPAAVKERALGLGFKNLRGVYNKVNGEYISPYLYKDIDSNSNLSYTVDIGKHDFINLLQENKELSKAVQSGVLKYCGGHCVVNNNLYIKGDNLTAYARTHIEEACVSFYKKSFIGDGKSSITCGLPFYFFDYICLLKNIIALNQSSSSYEQFDRDLPESFPEALVKIMQDGHYTINELEQDSGVSKRTISRLRNRDEQINESQKLTIIKICLGLRLKGSQTLLMLERAHIILNTEYEEDIWLFMLLSYANKEIVNIPRGEKINTPIVKAREYIEQQGFRKRNGTEFKF